VQTIHPLGPETGMKITTAYWYTPSGRCINKQRETSAVVLRDTTATRPRTFHTLGRLKRTLAGEGGIAPDIYVAPEKITGLATRVPTASYFDFATEYANSHPNLTMDFVADRAILEEFKNYLRTKKNFDFTEAEFDSAQQVIAQMIEIEMGGKIDGIHGEYQMRLRRDPELQKAIEILKPASSTEEILRRLK
jgi:carboxyl-terminal processing protease